MQRYRVNDPKTMTARDYDRIMTGDMKHLSIQAASSSLGYHYGTVYAIRRGIRVLIVQDNRPVPAPLQMADGLASL